MDSKEKCEEVKEILEKQLDDYSEDPEMCRCLNFELDNLNDYIERKFIPKRESTLKELIEYARVEREKRDNEAMKTEPKEKQTTKSSDYYER